MPAAPTAAAETVVLNLYQTLSLRAVSRETGYCTRTIQGILKRHGVEPRKTWLRKGASNDKIYAFDARHAELKTRYNDGESVEALAAELGVAPSTMAKILRRAGTEIRDHGPKPAADYRPGEVKCGVCKEWVPEKTYDGRVGACKKCARARWLKRTYGITPQHYDDMLVHQCGRCAVCRCEATHVRNTGTGNKRRTVLCVDHDHATGRVRGLLCSKCNQALGHLDDQVDWILKLHEYVSRG